MAQTKKRRRRKHRAPRPAAIDTRGPRGRPRTREEAKARARQKQSAKKNAGRPRDRPPTWSGAFKRGLIGAGVFFLLVLARLQAPGRAGAAVLSVAMLAMYVPLGYYIDRSCTGAGMRQQQAARAAKREQE